MKGKRFAEEQITYALCQAEGGTPPPIPSDDRFRAITTVAEIVREGEQMHHCVVTRAADALAGSCALYRVHVAGERATLEIAPGRDGEPLSIDELRLACNAAPSDATLRAVREWFEEGRRQWRERPVG